MFFFCLLLSLWKQPKEKCRLYSIYIFKALSNINNMYLGRYDTECGEVHWSTGRGGGSSVEDKSKSYYYYLYHDETAYRKVTVQGNTLSRQVTVQGVYSLDQYGFELA